MDMNVFSLQGKSSLVVGGAGGIGAGIVLALAEAGSDVLIADMNISNVSGLIEKIQALGRSGFACKVDITNQNEIDGLFKYAEEKFGGLDILVNTAGTNIRQPVLDITKENLDKVLSINLVGVVLTCTAAAKLMIKTGRPGRIINVASISSILAHPDRGSYAASKAGLVHISRTMGVEWAKQQITINSVSPTIINTAFVASGDEEQKKRVQIEVDKIPMGRIGEVEDVTGVIVFLASEASRFITGQNIIVDGGRALD